MSMSGITVMFDSGKVNTPPVNFPDCVAGDFSRNDSSSGRTLVKKSGATKGDWADAAIVGFFDHTAGKFVGNEA